MGIGHAAVGFAAKRAAPRTPLGILVAASLLVDALWGALVLAGVERARVEPGLSAAPIVLEHYPISHSLVAVLGWAVLVGAIYVALQKDWRAGLVLAALVTSHWVLDAASHLPDVPVGPHGPFVGLGLWRWRAPSALVETALLTVGVLLYLGATRPRTPAGRWGLALLVAVLLAANLGAYYWPPPSSIGFVAASDVALPIVLFAVGNAIDRHRRAIL